jgi:chromosome segregation ATPase
MSHPEGEGAQSGAEGTQSGAGTATGSTGTDSNAATDGAQSGAQGTQTQTEVERLAAQLEQQRTRTQAADKRAAEHEAALKQLRDKDLPEQQKLTRDLQEAQKSVEALKETNGTLAIQVAFLKDNTHTWHNPEAALKLVDMSQVEIAADGAVTGMKDALKALASAHPYLVKTEASTGTQTPGSTAPGNNGGSAAITPNAKALAARFPALRTRVQRG